MGGLALAGERPLGWACPLSHIRGVPAVGPFTLPGAEGRKEHRAGTLSLTSCAPAGRALGRPGRGARLGEEG